MAENYTGYYWHTNKGKKTVQKVTNMTKESLDTFISEKDYATAMTTKELNQAPDMYDKQQVRSYNTRLSEISSGKGKHYWAFQPDFSQFESGQHVRDIVWKAMPQYSSTGEMFDDSLMRKSYGEYMPAPQWMTADEQKIQTQIITQKRDIAQANIDTRQQEFSNRQTQANIEQSPDAGRGSSTRRKEKRGGRASTLLAGNLGGRSANVAARSLLGG